MSSRPVFTNFAVMVSRNRIALPKDGLRSPYLRIRCKTQIRRFCSARRMQLFSYVWIENDFTNGA
jgi:hypothetical protein